MRVGPIDIQPALDGRLVTGTDRRFPAPGTPQFAPHAEYLTLDGHYVMDVGSMVVRTADRVILIDAGGGPGDPSDRWTPARWGGGQGLKILENHFRDQGLSDGEVASIVERLRDQESWHGILLESLQGVGIEPRDVTDIVLSHLHWDHVGWVSSQGKPAFENADVWCARAEADYWLGADPPDETVYTVLFNSRPVREVMAPVLERLQLWEGSSAHIAPGIDVQHAPGHTPGSAIVILSSGADRAIILGDAVHCALELVDEDYASLSDVDRALARRTRETIRRIIEDGSVPVAGAHFPGLQFGRLTRVGQHRSWEFVRWQQSL